MKSEKTKQLNYLYDSIEGESWKITDSPEQLISLYNIVQKGEISVKNELAEIKWNISHSDASIREYPVFQTLLDADMYLQVGKQKRQKQLEVIRMQEAESISLKVPLSADYWHHIQVLTSKFEAFKPAIDSNSCCNQCDCEGCAHKQRCIKQDPSEHPFYSVLQHIIGSEEEYFFRLHGKTLGAGAMIHPSIMNVNNGVCSVQSTFAEVMIDLTQLYFIRVEQRTLDGVSHSVVEGKGHSQNTCFTLYSSNMAHYHQWAELVTRAKLVC